MLLTKGELHRLVDEVSPGAVAREVAEKLDVVAELFRNAAAMVVVPRIVDGA